MHSNTQTQARICTIIPLTDYGQLQQRYQVFTVSQRANAVLEDSGPALMLAEEILRSLLGNAAVKQIFAKIRKNSIIAGKMRPSEARDLMLDATSDFIDGTLHKLAAWRRTMERICSGEGVSVENGKEYIPAKHPVSLAIAGNSGLSNYLSIVQLALMELSKIDKKMAADCRSYIMELRRCATVIGDYENACGIASLVR